MATEKAPRLDARLKTAASLVKPGAIAADIGCDHGKLSAFLVCNGLCSRVIAADLRPGPLSVAKETCREAGCADRIDFRLGDGLQVVQPGEVDTIILAGISAQTTIEILEAAPWIKQQGMRLICVPATKAWVLRQWLWRNGFELHQEKLAKAAGRWYAVMGADYTGNCCEPSDLACVLGLTEQEDGAQEYQEQLAVKLAKMRRGLEQDPQAAARLDALLSKLSTRESE